VLGLLSDSGGHPSWDFSQIYYTQYISGVELARYNCNWLESYQALVTGTRELPKLMKVEATLILLACYSVLNQEPII